MGVGTMKISIGKAIKAINPNSQWMIENEDINNITWLSSDIPQPSAEEIQAKIQELEAAEPMRLLRIERNRRLADVDWITLKAYSQKQDVAEDWVNYMQALRDLPATAEPTLDDIGNLTNITWPEVPE